MNALFGIGILAGIIYSLMIDFTYMKIYIVLLIGYTLLTQIGTLSEYNNARKKCTIATWSGKELTHNFEFLQIAPDNAEILASFEWDATKALEYLDNYRKKTGKQVTITHLVGQCAAKCMSNEPHFNGRISFGNVILINSDS